MCSGGGSNPDLVSSRIYARFIPDGVVKKEESMGKKPSKKPRFLNNETIFTLSHLKT
jgi:hypothetical protein